MITQAITDSFILEILQGIHTPQDEYRMALYTADAILDRLTVVYTPVGEVIGQGYGAGGLKLNGYTAQSQDGWAFLDWADPVWPFATITARGGLIYNFSKGNRAVAVLDLEKNFTSTNGNFIVTLPEPTPVTALIGIGG
jgi:hypothetical protein